MGAPAPAGVDCQYRPRDADSPRWWLPSGPRARTGKERSLLAARNDLRSRRKGEEAPMNDQTKRVEQKMGELVPDLDPLRTATRLPRSDANSRCGPARRNSRGQPFPALVLSLPVVLCVSLGTAGF